MDKPEDVVTLLEKSSINTNEEISLNKIEKLKHDCCVPTLNFVSGIGKCFLDNFWVFIQYNKIIKEDILKKCLLDNIVKQRIKKINV